MSNVTTVGVDCKDCKHYKDVMRNKVLCLLHKKAYYYGQKIPCDDKEKIERGGK